MKPINKSHPSRLCLQILTRWLPSSINRFGKAKIRWWVVFIFLMLIAWPTLAKDKKQLKQVVIKEATRVEGKIQKPEVWYLLPRSNLKFEGVILKEKLAPKVTEPIKKDPF